MLDLKIIRGCQLGLGEITLYILEYDANTKVFVLPKLNIWLSFSQWMNYNWCTTTIPSIFFPKKTTN
jgi:hypothetical protein